MCDVHSDGNTRRKQEESEGVRDGGGLGLHGSVDLGAQVDLRDSQGEVAEDVTSACDEKDAAGMNPPRIQHSPHPATPLPPLQLPHISTLPRTRIPLAPRSPRSPSTRSFPPTSPTSLLPPSSDISPATPISPADLVAHLDENFLHSLVIDASLSLLNFDPADTPAFPGARKLLPIALASLNVPLCSTAELVGDPCILQGDTVSLVAQSSILSQTVLSPSPSPSPSLLEPSRPQSPVPSDPMKQPLLPADKEDARLKRVDSGWDMDPTPMSPSRTSFYAASTPLIASPRPSKPRPYSTASSAGSQDSMSTSATTLTTTVPPSPSPPPPPSPSTLSPPSSPPPPPPSATHLLLRPIPPAPFSPLLPISDGPQFASPTVHPNHLHSLLHQLLHPATGLPACDDPHLLRLVRDPDLDTIIVVDEHGSWGGWAMRVAEVLGGWAAGITGVSQDYEKTRSPPIVMWLVGGLRALRAGWPQLFPSEDGAELEGYDATDSEGEVEPIPRPRDTTVRADKGPAPGVGMWGARSEDPIGAGPAMARRVKRRQERMVDAVWYTPPPTLSDPPVCILSHLYLGSLHSAHPAHLARFGISTVIRLGSFPGEQGRKVSGVRYVEFEVEDSVEERLEGVVEKVGKVIEEVGMSGGKALVHCHAGVSRSATCVLAYLVCRRGMTLRQALGRVFIRRPIVRPNDGFAHLLRKLEMAHHPHLVRPTVPRFWLATSYLYTVEWEEWRWRSGVGGETELVEGSTTEAADGWADSMEVDWAA
ncbi:hypothetical protein M427DRAFT_262436 [Gonapodya prolifera JEL478]|uniref:Uncharacterized protein n=1 Tax=Gonapodya prolifera (strain JEL478) TaxID=1344416 RepID=A0A138ZX05_GONPJ|nr:hypothetical protein M427DRAFT_262436 [Gonapodya prolifera JEL478]|eukprot:KXS08994.1 hypothetical protein M427DRAFT_262436 [Gonapodya prolifera JEL478]